MNSHMFRVANGSRIALVAGAIAGQMRQRQQSEIQAIGMIAVYRMLKAVITAQNYLVAEEIHLVCEPEFVEATIGDKKRTAVRLTVRTQGDDAVDTRI